MMALCDAVSTATASGLLPSGGLATTTAATGLATLLVVDDEEMIVTVASKALSRMGYTILTAHSGQEAIAVARNHPGPIDVVVLDVDMAPMNGLEAFPYLRQARPNMRTLVCSGYGRDAAVRRLLDAGADAYLSKPYLIDDLAQSIRELLDAKANPAA